MMIKALEIEDILKLMATEIDNDNAYIRIDNFVSQSREEHWDDRVRPKALYIGPFSLYDPYF